VFKSTTGRIISHPARFDERHIAYFSVVFLTYFKPFASDPPEKDVENTSGLPIYECIIERSRLQLMDGIRKNRGIGGAEGLKIASKIGNQEFKKPKRA
jgi:hypothetical protein